MRKSLALLLSIAMVFSMFSSLAFAADPETAEEKYAALKAAGIFAGMEDGSAGLDQDMTRAQFARVAGLLLGLDVDASVSVSKFQDVKLTHWAAEEIHAIDAAGVMNGHGNMTFTPEANVTIEQVARVLVDALGLEVDADAEVEGASNWAQGYVKAAITAGLISPTADFQANATRELLVVSSYAAYQVVGATPAGEVSAAITGAKKITVQLGAVVDTTKVSVSLKKGAIATNVASTTFSDDKKSAVIETSTNLTAGEYTVTVTGLTETAITAVVTATDEKVTKVEFTTLNAILDRSDSKVVTANYTVENQYGENISNATDLTFSAGKGTAVGDDGVLTLTATAPATFTKDEKINVSALHTGTSTFTSGVLIVVDPAKVAEIAITGVYQADGNAAEVDATVNGFYLLVDVKDQYGNAVTNTTYINDDVVVTNAHTNIFPAFSQATTPFIKSGKDNDKMSLQLPATGTNKFLAAGTAKITIVSKSTGKLASYDLVVAEKSKVDVLTLSQPSVAVAGEANIEIPFTAVDQFGKEVTSLSTLTTTTTVSTSPNTGSIAFSRDYVKGVNKLKLNASALAEGTVVITAVANGKVTMLTVVLKAAAKPTVIAGVKNFDKVYAVGATDILNTADVIINDQYGREFTTTDLGSTAGEYQIAVSSGSDTKVGLTGTKTVVATTYGLSPAGDAVTFTGLAKGTSAITLKLVKVLAGNVTTEDVAGTSYTFTAKTVEKADIVTYEVADVATLYATNATTHTVDIDVKGVLADGSKVVLPASYYVAQLVAENDANAAMFDIAGKTIHIQAGITLTDGEAKGTLLVTFIADGSPLVSKAIVAKTTAPAIASLYLDGNAGGLTVVDAATLTVSSAQSNIADATALRTALVAGLKAKDQYGKSFPLVSGSFLAGVTVNSTTDNKALSALVSGNVVNATLISTNGKVVTVKIIVE